MPNKVKDSKTDQIRLEKRKKFIKDINNFF